MPGTGLLVSWAATIRAISVPSRCCSHQRGGTESGRVLSLVTFKGYGIMASAWVRMAKLMSMVLSPIVAHGRFMWKQWDWLAYKRVCMFHVLFVATKDLGVLFDLYRVCQFVCIDCAFWFISCVSSTKAIGVGPSEFAVSLIFVN